MKTSILAIIAIIYIGLTPVQAIEEVPRTPEELVKLYHQKSAIFDFEALAPHIHPYTLSKFREICNDMMLSFSEKYSYKKILSAFKDITIFDDLEDLSDEDYWIYIMRTMNSSSEEAPPPTHFKIITTAEDGKFLYIVYWVKEDPVTTLKDYRLRSPNTAVFLKHNGDWKHYGFEISSFEKYLEWHVKYQEKIDKEES